MNTAQRGQIHFEIELKVMQQFIFGRMMDNLVNLTKNVEKLLYDVCEL